MTAIQEAIKPNGELRPITPETIVNYIDRRIDSAGVKFSDKHSVTVPEGWNGAGKTGEALVKFGDMLTEPIAGTELSAEVFTKWMENRGFTMTDDLGIPVNADEAAALLESNLNPDEGIPVMRFTRVASGHTPVEIQVYYGGTCEPLKTLARIGNQDSRKLTDDARRKYGEAVRAIFVPFISKGTKDARTRLGLSGPVDILRRVDDCAASFVTILGDQLIDDRMQMPHQGLLEIIDVSVATTQAMVVASAMADRRKIPLVMRVGAPVFGMGSGNRLNYMENTLPEMRKYGPLAVGDMGKLMDNGDSAAAKPYMQTVRTHEDLRELRLFLGGGGPVFNIMQRELESRGKPMGWDISVRRASRVDNGPKEWAVLMSGSSLIVRPDRKDAVFLHPGKEIQLDHEMPGFVEPPGLWVSLGEQEGGYREASYVDRGIKRTVYLIQKAT
jgi:hypothetical protein